MSTETINDVTGEIEVRQNNDTLDSVQEKMHTVGDARSFISTFKGDDFDTRKKMLAAVTDSEPIGDHLNTTIMLKDFVLQATTMVEEKTNKTVPILRTILVDGEGKAYHAVSDGLFKALQNYVCILGDPSTWPAEGVAMTVVEKRGRSGYRFYTMKLA